jgi:hypothetical protein
MGFDQRYGLRTTDYGLITDFNSINYTDDGCVNRTLFAAECHSRGAALHNQDDFVNARAHSVHRDEMAFFILAIHTYEPRHKQLSPVKAVILPGGDYCSNYSSKNHGGCRGSGPGVRNRILYRNLIPGTRPLPHFSRDSYVTGMFSSTEECGRGIT